MNHYTSSGINANLLNKMGWFTFLLAKNSAFKTRVLSITRSWEVGKFKPSSNSFFSFSYPAFGVRALPADDRFKISLFPPLPIAHLAFSPAPESYSPSLLSSHSCIKWNGGSNWVACTSLDKAEHCASTIPTLPIDSCTVVARATFAC